AFLDLPGAQKWQKIDLTMASGPAAVVQWTSQTTPTGAMGNPELATDEKGEKVFSRAVEEMVDLVRWFRDRPDPERIDLHDRKPAFDLPFTF
ncbi:MAG: creatininase family protein, partial [Thermomicrobiales bacterium]